MMRRPFLLAVTLATTAPAVAHANDLGGLAYVVFIWPIGIALLLAAIALGIVGFRLLKRTTPERRHGGFAIALLAFGILSGLGYPLVAFGLDAAYDAGAPVELALVTVLPVEGVALLLCALGLAILRRGKASVSSA